MESGEPSFREWSGGRTVPPGATVRVVTGFYEGLEVPIDREWLVIGRGRAAELALAEPTISRAHAAIGYDGRCFFVQDLRSTNGTLVNGERRERVSLRDDDEIQIGRLRLRIRLPAERPAVRPSQGGSVEGPSEGE
jgi:pSer/pThr/pTyr-binding forkhead associated (FHA) protein